MWSFSLLFVLFRETVLPGLTLMRSPVCGKTLAIRSVVPAFLEIHVIHSKRVKPNEYCVNEIPPTVR
jgi:hypothetical protein